MNKISNQLLASPEAIRLCQKLATLPFYHLSLGSLEVFHSNFWAWMIEHVSKDALRIFDPSAVLDFVDSVQREPAVKNPNGKERRYLDLRVNGRRDGIQKSIVVENKIKSLISPNQLREIYQWTPNAKDSEFFIVSLFAKEIEPEDWKHVSYRRLCEGIRSFLSTIPEERHQHVVAEYLELIEALADLADELQKGEANRFDFVLSGGKDSLAAHLNKAKLYASYSKYRMSGLAKFVYERNAPWLRERGRVPAFETGESAGDVFFEHGYSYKSRDAFVEFVIPLCEGKARLGIQIAKCAYMYFLSTDSHVADKAAKLLDGNGLWFNPNRSRLRNSGFRTFNSKDSGFRYETQDFPLGTDYGLIAETVGQALKYGLDTIAKIEEALRPCFG